MKEFLINTFLPCLITATFMSVVYTYFPGCVGLEKIPCEVMEDSK